MEIDNAGMSIDDKNEIMDLLSEIENTGTLTSEAKDLICQIEIIVNPGLCMGGNQGTVVFQQTCEYCGGEYA